MKASVSHYRRPIVRVLGMQEHCLAKLMDDKRTRQRSHARQAAAQSAARHGSIVPIIFTPGRRMSRFPELRHAHETISDLKG